MQKTESFRTLFFGTPGETRTHYLALRRRTLYPGELRGRNDSVILPKKCLSVKNNRQLFALCAYTAWYRAKKEGIRCENVTITVWILRTFCMTKRKVVPVSGKIPG